MLAQLSEDDPLHSGVEFSDPEAGIPEHLLAVCACVWFVGVPGDCGVLAVMAWPY